MKTFFYTMLILSSFCFRVSGQITADNGLSIVLNKTLNNSSLLEYIVMNSSDKKIRSDFSQLKINITPGGVDGLMSLEIYSPKRWNLLIELKNAAEDNLI